MFSTAKFNATKLNASAPVNEVLLRCVFSEMLAARMGVGVELHIDSMGLAAALAQTVLGATAVPGELSLSGEMGSVVSAILAAPIENLFAERLDATFVHVRANHALTAQMDGQLTAKTAAGAYVWFAVQAADSLVSDALVGAEIASESTFSEILTVRPDASLQEEQSVLIRVSLPAGSELRIDSERYTVTLDGENILHLQEGDWLMLDRELCEVTVDSGVGAKLSGKMVWVERYL